MDTSQQQTNVQVTDRETLCKALASEMSRSDSVDYTVEYTVLADTDASSPTDVKKQNAKELSMAILKRVALRCPTYQWIRKSAWSTPHSFRNGFTCALAEQSNAPTASDTTKSCNGSLVISIIRRIQGQYTVRATLEHDFSHALCTIVGPAQAAAAAQAKTKAPTKASVSKVDDGIVKDVLRALGRRSRTPERVYTLPLESIKENKVVPTVATGEKRGRGRPRKELDAKAPAKPMKGLGKPRKNPGTAVPLMVNRTLSNQLVAGV